MRGAALRAYRQLVGYDQQEFADMVDANRKTVQRWETSEKDVYPDVEKTIRAAVEEWESHVDAIIDAHDGQQQVLLYTYRTSDDLIAHQGIITDKKVYNSAVAYAAVELDSPNTTVEITWYHPQ